MAKLIYSANRLSGRLRRRRAGSFDWAALGDELSCFVNDLARPAGIYLYRHRMYQMMLYRETARTPIGARHQDTDRTELRPPHDSAPEAGHQA
jgi:hypothetical protein